MIQDILQALLILLAFVAVLGGAWVATQLIARRSIRQGNARRFEIVDRMSLDRSHSVALVRFSKGYYLLGLSPQGMTLISSLDKEEALGGAPERVTARMPVTDIVDRLRARMKTESAIQPQIKPVLRAVTPIDDLEYRLLERSKRIQKMDAEARERRSRG